ncbi:DMT family transporter [Sandarakinorhabdus limnophila]|uniref:DMT family transporter n=1 Tax=Sandarakinorhabdus limnophila TaxID=210512 RepID=UPI0003B4B889|nr:DMT family transporter [Sandarakinorhabdus limnophila]
MATTEGRFTPLAWFAFIVCTLIWGSTWFVIRTQLGEVPPSWSVTWRFALGAAVMFGLCLVRGKSLRLTGRQHGFALLVAISQFVLNFNLVYRSEQYLASGLVSLTFAFLLVTNTALSAVFLGQRVTGRFMIGSAIGLAGVALLFAPDLGKPGGEQMGLGLALAFGGVISASVANVLQATPQGRAMPLEAGIAWAMAWGALIDGAVAWGISGPPVISTAPVYLAGLAYLGIAASAVAFNLYYILIRTVGAGPAAWNGVAVPVVAMALSTVLEGYQWTLTAVAGIALALIGLVIALKAKQA